MNGNSRGAPSIPSAAFDAMGIDSPPVTSSRASGGDHVPSAGGSFVDLGAASGGAAEKVCPHCTFANEAGRTDCEICGLPLDG